MTIVFEYPSFDMYSWIPQKYWDNLHIIPDDSDCFGFVPTKPLVVLDHGIFDITRPCIFPEKRKNYSLFYADYYLSSTKQGHEGLIKNKKKSFYTGSPFSDFVIPLEKKERDLLVYLPDHGIPTDNGWRYGDEVMPTENLLKIAETEGCSKVMTSALVEDERAGYYNPIYSDRRRDIEGHHAKCRYFLERAKVVVTQTSGTFHIVAKNLGIKIIGCEVKLDTLVDGKCRERILEVMDGIISGRY